MKFMKFLAVSPIYRARVECPAIRALMILVSSLAAGCASPEAAPQQRKDTTPVVEAPALVREGEPSAAVVLYYFSDGQPWSSPNGLEVLQFAIWPDGFVLFRPNIYEGLRVGKVREYRVADAANRMASAIARIPIAERLCDYERDLYGFYAVRDESRGSLVMCADLVETDQEPRSPALELCGILAWEIMQLTKGEEYAGTPSVSWQPPAIVR